MNLEPSLRISDDAPSNLLWLGGEAAIHAEVLKVRRFIRIIYLCAEGQDVHLITA